MSHLTGHHIARSMFWAIVLLFPMSLFVLWPTPTAAQSVCQPRADLVGHLARKYGEAPVAVGLASTGGLVEVIATPNGSTWTIIVTRPDGWACMVAAGQGWRNLKRATGTGT